MQLRRPLQPGGKVRRVNRGAYANPFSGIGLEFFPLGTPPDQSGMVLHEVQFKRRLRDWHFPRTFSPFWRLYYNLEPGHKVVFPKCEVMLGPDRIILIPDHCLFDSEGEGPVGHFWMTFSYARRPMAGTQIPIELSPTAGELALLRELIIWLGRNDQDKHRERIYHCSLALLHVVLSREELAWNSSFANRLQPAFEHIEKFYPQPLYVAELARMCHLSKGAFSRLFKLNRSVTPTEHIALTRVRESASLLVNTNLTMDDIAQRTGFPNSFYFSRIFKRLTGQTPVRFRKQHDAALTDAPSGSRLK
jgi:AraC-like DNA-binding protein